MKFLRRRHIAGDPVDLGPIAVEEEQEGRTFDAESLKERFSCNITPPRPIKDKIVFQEFPVLSILEILLNQQCTIPSAGFGEKVDEERFSGRFGFRQRVVKGAGRRRLSHDKR
jgi:hypothetical protein